MPRIALVAVHLALLTLVFACNSNDSDQPTPEPAQTTLATATDVPSEPRTGISEIDAVLDAVFSGDEEAVRALIGYSQTPCATNPQGLGSPPQCLGDEPDGALIDFFGVAHCHGSHVRPENMGGVISTLSQPGARLRAVAAIEGTWPDGDHVLVYDHIRDTNRIPHNALVLVLRKGTIVGIKDGCQGTPEEYLTGGNIDDPLLFIPPEGLTGIRDLDTVLDGLQLRNPAVLRAFITYQSIPCIATPEGIGAPPLCLSEEPLGERVEVFPLGTCEFEYLRRDEMDGVKERLAGAELYAVYKEGSRHVALMSSQTPGQFQAVRVFIEDRLIVEIDFTCILTPEEALAEVPAEDILVGPLWP